MAERTGSARNFLRRLAPGSIWSVAVARDSFLDWTNW
jgi:hypothetical protein